MSIHHWSKQIVLCILAIWGCCTCFAEGNLYQQARTLQRKGKFDDAATTYQNFLTHPVDEQDFNEQEYALHTEALMQLMYTYQSMGDPEACVIALRKVFKGSNILRHHRLRDYYSVLGYALSRTENMKEAEETILKAITLPLNQATPERYFRDYAYAAAVFYSNPQYQNEVINWCEEALRQADLCENTSGKQWVTAMLGAFYKRNGHLNKALTLFQQSKEEAERKGDNLGVINSLHALVDLFLYWQTPEYANIYASEALRIENAMTEKNPMVSAQTYINKGWVMYQLGEVDSVAVYTERARQLSQSLPYNSGMVDFDLLHGTYLTELGGDSLQLGIQKLQHVAQHATTTNRAKAFHQLGLTYLELEKSGMAEAMLDSMFVLLTLGDVTTHIHIDYQPILHHYFKNKNYEKIEHFTQMMLQERQAFKEKKLNFNIVESIVNLQTAQKQQELEFTQLRQTNQLLLFLCCIAITFIIIAAITIRFMKQRKAHAIQMKEADEKLTSFVEQLHQSNAERGIIAQEVKELLEDKDKRKELKTLTPSVLQTSGETKFRQFFELLYPLFLPRLRERIPSITRREELLSMLIILKQDNKQIAELLAIAPRSVLMLRHRLRQKIGMTTDLSLDKFIADALRFPESNDKPQD